MHLGGTATMPGSEQDTAASALMLDVLERVHDVGDASQAGEAAETESPGAVELSVFVLLIQAQDKVTHCVVLPISYETLVMARWPQAGQSAGAGDRLSEAMGVAV